MPTGNALPKVAQKLDELFDELKHASEDELEELSDMLIDELLSRIRFPWWAGFAKGYVRRKLDDLLPWGIFQAIAGAVRQVRTARAQRDIVM